MDSIWKIPGSVKTSEDQKPLSESVSGGRVTEFEEGQECSEAILTSASGMFKRPGSSSSLSSHSVNWGHCKIRSDEQGSTQIKPVKDSPLSQTSPSTSWQELGPDNQGQSLLHCLNRRPVVKNLKRSCQTMMKGLLASSTLKPRTTPILCQILLDAFWSHAIPCELQPSLVSPLPLESDSLFRMMAAEGTCGSIIKSLGKSRVSQCRHGQGDSEVLRTLSHRCCCPLFNTHLLFICENY